MRPPTSEIHPLRTAVSQLSDANLTDDTDILSPGSKEPSMPLAPPGIVRRWSVIGRKADHSECTTIFDLPTYDRTHVIIHPGGVTTFTVTITRSAIRILLDTIESGTACTVPATHPVHGQRLLGLRPVSLPNEPAWTDRQAEAPPSIGPMELYVHLPDAKIEIIYHRNQLIHLATTLAVIFLGGDSTDQAKFLTE
jgi:hypothetical protein